jgi:hypothetical protein
MKKSLFFCLFLAALASLWAEKPKRCVELGFDADVSAANNYLGLFGFFNPERTIVIEPARLSESGLWLSGAGRPEVFLNINFGEKFGLGFFAGLDAALYGNIPGDFFRFLAEGNRDLREFTSDVSVGASVFVDAGLKTAFQFGKLKLGFVPTVYVPALYIPPPDIRYRVDSREGIKADLSIDAAAYTALPLDGFSFSSSGSKSKSKSKSGPPETKDRSVEVSFGPEEILGALEFWGLDFSLDAEYALNPRWDLGGSVRSIPLYPSTLRYGISCRMDYSMDPLGDKDINDLINGEGIELDDFEPEDPVVHDDLAFRVFRPLRFDFYANFKPLSTKLIVLRPNIGFSALTVYGYDKACFNAGLEAQLNLKRVFSLSLATGYREKVWRHGLNLMLNLRVLELDLGVSLQSQDFAGSFRIQGAGAHAGVRLGF